MFTKVQVILNFYYIIYQYNMILNSQYIFMFIKSIPITLKKASLYILIALKIINHDSFKLSKKSSFLEFYKKKH
jgi:hypothetical protein